MSEQPKKTSAALDLLNGNIATTLLRFSVPFMISTLLQTLYSTIDTIIVGQFLGSVGLSAVSNGTQLMQMLYMLCIGFATAGQILIAQYEGAGEEKKIQRVFGTLFWMELGLSVALGVLCLIFSRQFLSVLHTPEEAFEQANYYIVICSAGMVFTGLFNMFSAVLRGLGDSNHPLLFVVISSVLNIFLDILFIAAFKWNVAGAALATVIAQGVSVAFSLWFFVRHSEVLHFKLQRSVFRFEKSTAGRLVSLGIPMAIQSGAIQLSFLFVNSMVNTLGVSVSAALGVIQKLRNIPGILSQGLSLGTSSMIGQNWGAGNLKRVSGTVNWCLVYSGIVSAVFAVIFLCFPTLCFRLFTQDQTVLAYAWIGILSLVVELPARIFMPGCNALVSAQGFVQFSFIIAMVDAFLGRILFCWLFGIALNMGAFGFFMGCSLGTYLTAIPVFIYYISGLWKRRKVLD